MDIGEGVRGRVRIYHIVHPTELPVAALDYTFDMRAVRQLVAPAVFLRREAQLGPWAVGLIAEKCLLV